MANEKRLISAEQAYEVARLHHNDFAQSIADLTSLREVLEDCDTVDAVPAEKYNALKEQYERMKEIADILDTALRQYQRQYGE